MNSRSRSKARSPASLARTDDRHHHSAPRANATIGILVQIARLGDIDDLNSNEKAQVMNQRSYSKMVLPNVPTLGKTLYVDFRVQITLDSRLLQTRTKIASLSEFGQRRLRVGLLYYYLRKEPPAEFLV
jgi:hypothetical protein